MLPINLIAGIVTFTGFHVGREILVHIASVWRTQINFPSGPGQRVVHLAARFLPRPHSRYGPISLNYHIYSNIIINQLNS